MCEIGRLMEIQTVWLQIESTVVSEVLPSSSVCIYDWFLYSENSGVRSITTTNEYVSLLYSVASNWHIVLTYWLFGAKLYLAIITILGCFLMQSNRCTNHSYGSKNMYIYRCINIYLILFVWLYPYVLFLLLFQVIYVKQSNDTSTSSIVYQTIRTRLSCVMYFLLTANYCLKTLLLIERRRVWFRKAKQVVGCLEFLLNYTN